jgi:glycosyltransferase involved in cell wall biosynthesis
MNSSIGENISVCLLTYNHLNVVGSTMESIMNQTISGFEIVVSDDCSNDGTWERILEIAKGEERIKPIQTPKNLGMPGNANFAAAHCSRPFIALLHHDDLYRSDLLEKWAAVLERHASAGFVFNHYDSQNPMDHERSSFKDECFNGRRFLEEILLSRWDSPIRGTAMLRKEHWDRVGGMREEFGLVADVDLWMRLAAIGDVGYVPERLIYVRALRPDYYPDIYTGKYWHWKRLVLLYKLYAANQLAITNLDSQMGRIKWRGFKLRLNLETLKWLAYAVVKRRYDMISSSSESTTEYDMWPLHAFRRVLQLLFRSKCPVPTGTKE